MKYGNDKEKRAARIQKSSHLVQSAAASSGEALKGGAGREVNFMWQPSWGKIVAMTLWSRIKKKVGSGEGICQFDSLQHYSLNLFTQWSNFMIPI